MQSKQSTHTGTCYGEAMTRISSSRTIISARTILLWLTCVYAILLPIGTGLAGIIGSISLMNYIAVAMILFGSIALLSNKNIFIKKFSLPTIAYFIYTAVSILWAQDIVFNWYVATNIMNGIIFLVLSCFDWEEKDIRGIEKSILLSQIIVIIAVIRNISSLFSYRLNITIVSTIGISDFACGLCLMIALWMNIASTSEQKRMKVLAYISVAVDFAIILMSGSRGALIMVVCMALVWILMGAFGAKTKAITILSIILVIFIFENYFISYLPATVTNRMSLQAIQETHGSGRFNLWTLAWNDFKASNIGRMMFGYGFDSFTNVIGYGSHGGSRDMMAHNVIFQTMIEGGGNRINPIILDGYIPI